MEFARLSIVLLFLAPRHLLPTGFPWTLKLIAMALFGYGIKGGTTVGGHSVFGVNTKWETAQLSGQFIDYESGEIFETTNKHEINDEIKIPRGVDLIRPANALETVLRIVLPDVPSIFGGSNKPLSKIIAG